MPYLFALLSGIFSGSFFIYFPVFSILFALTPSLYLFLKNKYLSSIVCLILALTSIFYVNMHQSKTLSDENNKTIIFEGYIIAQSNNFYWFKTTEGKTIKIYFEKPLREQKVYEVECKRIEEHKNPFSMISKNPFCFPQKIEEKGHLKFTFFDSLRNKINKELKEKLSGDTANVLIAMTVGYRHEISNQIREDFQKTGLIHLLSISGAHFSLIFTFFFLIFRFFLKNLPYRALVYLTQYMKPSQLAIILCFPIVIGYFFLVEPNYPSSRAFIMATFFMIGVLTERKSLWFITVSIACLIILIIEPDAIFDISFQLSFLATAGIGFATDIFKEFKDKISNRLVSYIFLSLLVSISAVLFTAPIIAYKFHYLSLISPFANISAGLLIGMILFPLNLIFIILFLITGFYPFPELIEYIAKFSFYVMHLLASFKYSAFDVPAFPLFTVFLSYFSLFIMVLSFYMAKRWKRRILLSFSFLLIFFALLIGYLKIKEEQNFLKITFLDVGQADSSIIETPSGVFIVDTGKTGFESEQFLKAKGYKDLVALIISHEQRDHAGGFLRILNRFNVNEIWDNGHTIYNIKAPLNLRHLERGDVLKVGNCEFTVLHPYRGFYVSSLTKDSNELSLIFKFKCFKREYLFLSDAGKSAIENLPLEYLKTDLVKIPHHGSKHSFYEDFYKSVMPDICIISAGKSNPYGHPHREVIEYLSKICRIYRTDIEGAIQIKEDNFGNINIQSFEESRFKPYRDIENLKKMFILW
ncbi:DNA internalization-related competence protein ComEC/Rec2 [Thermodesulfovibrio sp. N1]|nr:DNA internalization-related competence protein ComEC/Rec2 [Thermodesulfovibrio sp. N1]